MDKRLGYPWIRPGEAKDKTRPLSGVDKGQPHSPPEGSVAQGIQLGIFLGLTSWV